MDMNAGTGADTAMQNALAAGTSAKGAANLKNVDKASKDFEAMFMSQMLQPMFEGMDVDETFGGGHGEQMMRSLLTQEYGKAMASTDNFGLSNAIKAEMIKMQGQKATGQASSATVAAYATAGGRQ